jgi:hypothetical protein
MVNGEWPSALDELEVVIRQSANGKRETANGFAARLPFEIKNGPLLKETHVNMF